MARDLRGKKMPAKPMKQAEADEELELDMPMPEEEQGTEEADEDMLPSMDEESDEMAGPLDEVSDDDLIAEMQKRGLSMDDSESSDQSDEMPAEEPSEEY